MSGPTANGRINNTRTKSEIGWTRNEASFKPIPSTLQATGSAKKTCLPRALKPQPSVPFPQPSTNTIRSTRPPFSTSSSTPASIRSSVTASPPSRIAHPRTTAISLGTPPRVTIAFGTKSPSATKTVNTALARPLNPLVPSPRPAKTAKSRTSAVATISSPKLMDSTGQQRRDSLVNGRRLQTDVKQIQRPKDLKTVDTSAAEISKELGLLSGDVKVLKSVWEDSVANPTSFDEGSIDRNAIKSGYGSVFGFSLVSKPRNSIAVTEDSSLDRSQSISSIDSTFSSHSVASTKTISQLPVASSSETTTQTIPQRIPTYDSFLHDTSPKIAAPPSPTGRHLSSMHQTPHLPAQFSANSPDALDVYTAVQYLRSNSSTPELEFQLPASSSKDIVREDSASGPRSRASLRATSHVGYTRVAAGSSRTTSSAKDSPVTRARVPAPVDVRSEPSGYGTEGMESSHTTFTTTAPTSTFTSRNHIHPTELTNAATASRSTSLESSLQRSPGSSYGQRYTSPLSPSSSHISSPSPYLPVDQSSSPPTVNIKRLLSKPAPAGNSSASESESGPVVTRSPVVRRIERIEEKMEKQRIEAITKDRALESDVEGPVIPSSSFDGSRERDRARKTQWEAERRLLRQRSLSSHPTPAITTEAPIEKRSGLGGLLVRNTSLSRSREREGPEKPEKKSRNVLKRRPSATARATSPPPEPTNVMEFPYSSFAPAYTGSILPVASAPRPTTSSGNLKAPLTGSSSTRGPSPAPLEDKRRSLIPQSALLKHGLGLSDDNASVSSGTTPAKEVMLAYKQQQEREKMREKERSERAREKQRERELWQREEEERRQRVLKAEIVPAPSTLPTNSLSNGVSSAQVNGQQSSSTPSSKSSPVPNVNDNSPSTQSSNHIPSRTTKSSRESGLTDGEPSHPYYTILGNSKRVVAAEDTKIEDSYISDFSWSNSHSVEGISSSIGLGIGQPSGSPQSRSGQTWGRSASVSVGKPLSKSSSSFTIGKTLSRKVSGRLGTSVREPSLDVSGTPPTLIERGRPSLQERGLTMKDGTSSRPRGEKRNLRMSIDAYPSNSPLSPMKNSMLPRSPPIPDGGSVTPASKSSFSPSTHSSLPSPTGHSSGKNRIWNLMKRISTGGLRDSYHKYDSPLSSPLPPPPVPAIPKDLSLYAREMKRKEGGDMIIGQQKPDDISTVHPLLTRKRSSPSTPSRIPSLLLE
ncbi:hypothetical protein BDP27DRAFT_623460 [Rhodocollybia butyracea]|uniref:Uncharacterized protein n=1 Tax=Rhodocollybia butyracea TaxID=206335 RepID=A0A9P5PQM0_9AGAR|nr:hypothetical protein BDP27DRAFT_623460 [Rhodocollybia butyracea]